MNSTLVQEFKLLILDGYYSAETVHSVLFSDNKIINNSVVIGYLAIANSYINAAKSVYICNEELSRQEFDEFFNEFRAFSNEVMENIRTNHSHQWSDIHFQRFKDSYEPVASFLGVVK